MRREGGDRMMSCCRVSEEKKKGRNEGGRRMGKADHIPFLFFFLFSLRVGRFAHYLPASLSLHSWGRGNTMPDDVLAGREAG